MQAIGGVLVPFWVLANTTLRRFVVFSLSWMTGDYSVVATRDGPGSVRNVFQYNRAQSGVLSVLIYSAERRAAVEFVMKDSFDS